MIHLTLNGSHRDTRTMCGERVNSAMNPHWVETIPCFRLLPPGYYEGNVCPECFKAAGITPWPDLMTGHAAWDQSSPAPLGQLTLGDVA